MRCSALTLIPPSSERTIPADDAFFDAARRDGEQGPRGAALPETNRRRYHERLGDDYMGASGALAAFDGAINHDGGGIVAMAWRGHIDRDGLRGHLHHLDALIESSGPCFLLIDSTLVSGYDLDAHAIARQWSKTSAAHALHAVAVVAESRLAAAESPAWALAPPQRAQLFASVHPARAWLQRHVVARSGEYDLGTVRALAATRR